VGGRDPTIYASLFSCPTPTTDRVRYGQLLTGRDIEFSSRIITASDEIERRPAASSLLIVYKTALYQKYVVSKIRCIKITLCQNYVDKFKTQLDSLRPTAGIRSCYALYQEFGLDPSVVLDRILNTRWSQVLKKGE